jgi:Family of unknown function (DUF6325)
MTVADRPRSAHRKRRLSVSIGPVEYMVVAFPGNKFKGEIVPALQELVDSGTIRIIDLAFVHKDANGDVVAVELEDEGSEVFSAFETITMDRDGLISDADMMGIADALDPDSSAAILVWEDVWATRFADAVVGAGGVLVDIQRVPRDIVQAAIDFASSDDA